VRLLEGIPDDEARRVLARCRRRRFAAREVIFHEGDPADGMHLIAAGRVTVRVTTSSGSTATLDIVGPGDPLGELALLTAGAPRSATATALVATETMALAGSVFAELRATFPAVTDVLVAVLAERNRSLTARLMEALYLPAETRVARRLLDVAARFPGKGAGPVVVSLTQDDLADLAGTTRETVNRTLGQLAARGVVAVGRGRVTVLDEAALRRRAGT
jgi:CRP/FNR family cyclic AMP-dependent transcriptional regulator